MAVDILGPIKENKKILGLVAGLCLVVVVIAVTAGSGNGFGTIGTFGNGSSTSGDVTYISNGNNGKYYAAPNLELKSGVDYQARIRTSMGDITIELYEDEAPITVNNFVFLSNDSFYNGSSFHRVIDDFLIQGGDPLGNGKGGPGYSIANEISPKLSFTPYTVAMGKTDVGSDAAHGSQFFITTRYSSTSDLTGSYPIFGKVIDGYDVVDKIEAVDVADTDKYDHVPYDPITITGIDIIEK